MKKIIMFAFISGIAALITGCDNNKPKTQKDTPFSVIPYECKVVGKINIDSILKIEDVSQCIIDNKNMPYMKEIKAAGLGINNIESVIFGIELDSSMLNTSPKNTTPSAPKTPDGVIIISAKSKVNVTDFIKIAEKNSNGAKFKVTQIEDKTAYILPAIENNAETYIVQLNDKLIAVGTQKDTIKAVELANTKGRSILEDEQIMKLSNNICKPDLLWLATVIPDGFIPKTDKNIPNVKAGLISVNYLNDCLKISGIINCTTKEDAQKLLLTLQMASSIIAMSSNSILKSEDFSIKADNTVLSLDLNITKKASNLLLAKHSSKLGKYESIKRSKEDTDFSKEGVLKDSQQFHQN